MSGVLSFVNAAVGLVFGWIADFVKWLRKPGSALKLVCALLAVGFAVACLASYRQAQQIVVITGQAQQCAADAKAAADAAQLDRAELEDNIADKDAALATISANLKAEAEKLKKLQERNGKIRRETEAAKAAADTSASAFKREYDQRPEECTSALAALAAACPKLGGY